MGKPAVNGTRQSTRRTGALESAIQRSILLDLNSIPGVAMWRNNVGVDTGRGVRYGLCPGSADLIGCVQRSSEATGGSIGVFVALEIKRSGQLPTTRQRAWLACVRRLGGVAEVVHTLEQARKIIAGVQSAEGNP